MEVTSLGVQYGENTGTANWILTHKELVLAF